MQHDCDETIKQQLLDAVNRFYAMDRAAQKMALGVKDEILHCMRLLDTDELQVKGDEMVLQRCTRLCGRGTRDVLRVVHRRSEDDCGIGGGP